MTLDDAYKSTRIEIPYPDRGILGCAYNILVVVANVKYTTRVSLINKSAYAVKQIMEKDAYLKLT